MIARETDTREKGDLQEIYEKDIVPAPDEGAALERSNWYDQRLTRTGKRPDSNRVLGLVGTAI
jgi:hypothetical protein